jgi:hypothetical protein
MGFPGRVVHPAHLGVAAVVTATVAGWFGLTFALAVGGLLLGA